MDRIDFSRHWGAALMLAAAAVGVAVALWSYFAPSSGIDGTPGALLVLVSSALLALDAVILLALAPGALRWTLLALGILAIVGTFVAAWFLHAWWLMAAMAVAAIGAAADIIIKQASPPVGVSQ